MAPPLANATVSTNGTTESCVPYNTPGFAPSVLNGSTQLLLMLEFIWGQIPFCEYNLAHLALDDFEARRPTGAHSMIP